MLEVKLSYSFATCGTQFDFVSIGRNYVLFLFVILPTFSVATEEK